MNVIENEFSKIYGIPAWNVKKGHGSFLTFEFGQPKLIISERKSKKRDIFISGEWHFWVYCCDWKYYFEEKLVAHNESSNKLIEKATYSLDGQALKDVRISEKVSTFVFDFGGKLEIKPNISYKEKDKTVQWMFFLPDENVYNLRADGKYSFHSSNSNGKVKWLKLK